MPPLRRFQHGFTKFRLCADCELVADPQHPDDYRFTRSSDDNRPLYLDGSRRALTPPVSVPPRNVEPKPPTTPGRSSTIARTPRGAPHSLPVPETVASGFGDEKRGYAAKSRSANTVRAYQSDWSQWCAWCEAHGHIPLPAAPDVIARYLTFMVRGQSKVSTMSRRLVCHPIRAYHRQDRISARRCRSQCSVGRYPANPFDTTNSCVTASPAAAVGMLGSNPNRECGR
jgi:hypothetical protein